MISSAACSGARSIGGDPFSGTQPGQADDDRVVFAIQNDDYRDATVTASWNGVRTRVGRVTGNTTQTFRVRWRDVEMYFEIDFTAGSTIRSRAILVNPGDRVELQILVGERTMIQKTS